MSKETKPMAKVYKLPKTQNYFVSLWEYFVALTLGETIVKKKKEMEWTYLGLFKWQMPETISPRVDVKVKDHLMWTIKQIIKRKKEEMEYGKKMIESNEKEIGFFSDVLATNKK